MLIPLELNILAMRRGYLSPELALGWCVGTYLTDFFCTLEDIRIAARKDDDAALGLRIMSQKNQFPFPITIANGNCSWDFLAYHYSTGTVLQFKLASDRIKMPIAFQRLQKDFTHADPTVSSSAITLYQSVLNELIVRILSNPLDRYCRITETRIRFLAQTIKGTKEKLHCRLCDCLSSKSELVDSDGVVCCILCAGLEPSWFEWT